MIGGLDFFMNSLSNISFLGFAFFGSIIFTPTLNVIMLTYFVPLGTAVQIGSGNIVLALTILFIGYFITQFVSSIIAGRLSESRNKAFGAWFLTSVVCGLLLILFTLLGNYTTVATLSGSAILFGDSIEFLLLLIYLASLINGIFYGCIALLALKSLYLKPY